MYTYLKSPHKYKASTDNCYGCNGKFCKECGQCDKPFCTSNSTTNPHHHPERLIYDKK